MERIVYRRTLDVHKNGIQFMLQGFETADKLSRVIEISLMASGDAVDFPLNRMVAMMYVTTPGATEPSINECTIKDNKVVYEVLPIVEEGLTTMQIKLIEVGPDGATSVLATPKFSVEVTKSGVDDGSAEQKTTFTALEDAMAKAKIAYDERFLRMELTNDCIFKAYYADGTVYETDILKKLFHNGNVLLSESFAHGGTGTRIGEDTDNAKYYSDLSRSEALNAKSIMEGSEEILEEVKLHGVYTAFSVNFETGEVEYVSPSFKFKVNTDTGELEADGQSYTFDDEIGRVVTEWLGENGVALSDLQKISEEHSKQISTMDEDLSNLTEQSKTQDEQIAELYELSELTPIERGGTGARTQEEAIVNLGIDKYQKPWNVDGNVGRINYMIAAEIEVHQGTNPVHSSVEKSFEIFMKNSGTVFLDFDYRHIAYNSPQSHEESAITVYINDVAVETYSNFVSPSNSSYSDWISCRTQLNVKFGDVVKIHLKEAGTTNGTDGSSYRKIVVSNIQLKANLETPYTYYFLDGSVPDDSEVLNALLGV